MRRYLAIAALVASVLASTTSARVAEEAAVIELAAPRAAAGSESVELAVTTGALPLGARQAFSADLKFPAGDGRWRRYAGNLGPAVGVFLGSHVSRD